MLVRDAQHEVRTVFVGGFWGQLACAMIWLIAAALGTWVSARDSILMVVIGCFFLYPITLLLLKIQGRPASLSRENRLGALGMEIAFTLGASMLLLIPVANFRLNLFYPALLILVGAHYFPFTFLYGMRSFFLLAGTLIISGIMIAHYVPGSFSCGAWVGGVVLFVFAWILRVTGGAEARANLKFSTPN